MGRAYWAKSMVIARLTGVPYRQNDMVVSKRSGRVLFRSQCVERMELDEDSFVLMRMPTQDGRLMMEVWQDPGGKLGEHVKREAGQENMRCYQRCMARVWCNMHKVDELRLEIKAMARVSDRMILVEVDRVEDIAELCCFNSRKKKSEGV